MHQKRYLALDAFRGFIMLVLVSAGFGFHVTRPVGLRAIRRPPQGRNCRKAIMGTHRLIVSDAGARSILFGRT